jgi:hypothetical protein
MPCVTWPFDPSIGPILVFGITAPASMTPAGALPADILWLRGLIDTGCSHTSLVSSSTIAANLPIISKTTVLSTTHAAPANIYLGDLHLGYRVGGNSYHHTFSDMPFTELLRGDQNFDALIGRNVLGMGSLFLNGFANQFTFCW